MSNKLLKNFLALTLLLGALLAAHFALAQGFGVNEVNNGLAGSLSASDPRTVAGRIINIILGFLGVIAVGLVSYAGFMWLTAGGNEEKIETAKKILRNGLIGLAIILASWGIATFIISKLGGATGNGNGSGCYEGQVASCGCGGSMVCSGGSFGACIGSDCNGNGGGPTNCDASPSAGCQAADQICASNKYCDHNDCSCRPKGNLGDPCNASPDNSVCSPDNNRCADYLSCNPQTCVCYGPPVITEISPVGGFCQENINKSCTQDSDCATACNLTTPNGSANNFITILGKNFGDYSATSSKVIFAASSTPVEGRAPSSLNPACVSTWRDDQIVIAVPSGVSTGPIEVVNKDGLSDTTGNSYGPAINDFQANNINRPGLCYLDPNRGILTSAVGYQGINLYSGQAYFGNYQSNIKALDSQFNSPAGLAGTSTTPNIRAGDSGSFVQTNLNGHLEKSNYLRFVKEPEPGAGPYISSFYPTIGNTGQYVTIHGSDFGGARGTSHVYFGNTEATYDFPDMCLNSVWKNNQVIVKVPAGLADGYQTIKMTIGTTTIDSTKLNPNAFQFDKNLDLKSSLCKIEPERGPAATPVALWGEYFGPVNGEGLVKFNYDKSATGTIKKDGRADTIKTAVPAGAITGPVRVINNSVWGNELNFSIGECTADSDCGTQICCPVNTYKAGRCANTAADCFINIPTSVFEWSFSTSFSTSSSPFDSCYGLAKYYGACQIGATCPNVPGSCSPYAGGGKKIVADCNYSCANFTDCGLLGTGCHYDASVDKCIKNEPSGGCDLPKPGPNIISDQKYPSAISCNKDQHWEISLNSSCPAGWTKAANNKCVDLNSTCTACSSGLSCEKINPADTTGRCVSVKLCPSGAVCAQNFKDGQDKCVVPDQPTCDCCCTIGQDAQDCCAYKNEKTGITGQLKCEGTCGSDTGKTSGVTLGKCGGCKAAGDTPEERDAACNCSGHSGQFCDTNNAEFPDGVCTDCSSLQGQDCSDHSSVCCLDAKKTATTTDDICRGGNGLLVTSDKNNPDYGYCGYYNCQSLNSTPPGDPAKCASSTPVKIGDYSTVASCANDCKNSDPCAGITDIQECQKHSNCCFDAKNTTAAKCRLGDAISYSSSGYTGYCAYYDCATSYSSSGYTGYCASTTPVKLGAYSSIDSCNNYCANPPSGPGLSCAGQATSTCDTTKCNFEGFGCYSANGQLGVVAPDCGTCCCQPGSATDYCAKIDPKLKCLADKGNCSGASRGLCCGCSSDAECGSKDTVGCASDTCCQSRPEIISTSPAHLADKVCRNAVIKVDFNSGMDTASFNSNVLLLEERDYVNGVCPTGTFVASGDSLQAILDSKNKNWLARLIEKLQTTWSQIARSFSGSALADALPSASKLYCAVSGTAAGENNGNNTSLVFTPQRLLDPSANYYLVVKGDEDLNSKAGVLSVSEVGFNGRGYGNDASLSSYTEGANIKFNNRSYKNSQIIKFTTLSDQSPSAGICAIDQVKIAPTSYLFKTADNSLVENDSNAGDKTFDTVSDRDKVFVAEAYSADGQALHPVTGYFWDWNFSINNSAIAAISAVSALPQNRAFVSAKTGVTDGETKINATINMSRFLNGCTSGNCSCQGDNCSNNCCNAYSGGDGFNKASNLYVFLCNNPWPPVGVNGEWLPWVDNCQGSLGGNCSDYNYKFYYCRDAGGTGTLDDLPAITNEAVIRGLSSNFICSSDRSPCATLDAACGADKNGDGHPDGLCVWNILKESYFFREGLPSGGQILDATDQKTGGAVKVSWRSASDQANSYKVYYLKSGRGTMLSQEVKASVACTTANATNNCSTIIGGLNNDSPYIFKVSVISVNKTESQLSNEKTATPTDQTPPMKPANPQGAIINSQLRFSWAPNTDQVSFYRLYHGVMPGQYGESFDSAISSASLAFSLDQFPAGANYFALSALDDYKNESVKSGEVYMQSGYPDTITIGTREYDHLTSDNWWYKASGLADTPNGRACLVKLNIDPATKKAVCDNSAIGTSTAWFSGNIKINTDANGSYPYCLTTQCGAMINSSKCRWSSGVWSDQCYIYN